VTLNVHGDLYIATAQPGEPAHFGILLRPIKGDLCALLPQALCNLIPNILPPVILQSAVQLRDDFGLNTVIKDIPNSTSGLPTTINSQDITLFGTAPGTGKPFMRNPTSCPGPHTTTFTAIPYSGAADTATTTFNTTGCESLDFSPSFTAFVGGPGQTASGVPTSASTSIDQDLDEAGLLRAAVTVPADFNANVGLFGGTCDLTSFLASNCPPSALVGSAVAASPLLSQPLTGPVQLVNAGGPFPDIGLNLQGQLHLILRGSLDISKTTTFNGLPDIPISHFQLSFTNPPALLGTSRDLCVGPPPVFHAEFQGYNGASRSVDAPATVDGCSAARGACPTRTAGRPRQSRRRR
jgi:hypothetical protein